MTVFGVQIGGKPAVADEYRSQLIQDSTYQLNRYGLLHVYPPVIFHLFICLFVCLIFVSLFRILAAYPLFFICLSLLLYVHTYLPHHTATVLRPLFQNHPGEPVPEKNF